MMCLWMIVFWIGYSTMPALTQCVSSARADRLAVTEWVPLHIEMQIAASHYQPVLTIPDRGVFLDIVMIMSGMVDHHRPYYWD